MSLYTKFGDTGQTMLYGGKRVKKSDTRVHAYGSIDEVSALLGVILAEEGSLPHRAELMHIQRVLYRAGADLATPLSYQGKTERIRQTDVEEMERAIDVLEATLRSLTHFVLPGGTRVGALLHQTRTVCRRAERWVVALAEQEEVNGACIRYLNRLGDFLFALARTVNAEGGETEIQLSSSSLP